MNQKYILLCISLIMATSIHLGAMEKTTPLVKTAVATNQVLTNTLLYGVDRETLLQFATTLCAESGLECSVVTYQGNQNLDQAGFDAFRRNLCQSIVSTSRRQQATKLALIIDLDKINRSRIQDPLDLAVLTAILTLTGRESRNFMIIVLSETDDIDQALLSRCDSVIDVANSDSIED